MSISLIDLSKQIPFEIDDTIKKQLCFSETLAISCCHHEGNLEKESETSWTCDDTSSSEVSDEDETPKEENKLDLAKVIELQTASNISEDVDNFDVYFFPDCSKPVPPVDSQSSIIVVNGLPRLNPNKQEKFMCTCKLDKTQKCTCFSKLPCECGSVTKSECTCAKLETVCVCQPKNVFPECKCADMCFCYSDDKPVPICTCCDEKLPCACDENDLYPKCVCNGGDPPPEPKCFCHKGQERATCVCDALKDSDSSAREVEDKLSQTNEICRCIPEEELCSCGNGKKCKCNICSCVPSSSEGGVCISFHKLLNSGRKEIEEEEKRVEQEVKAKKLKPSTQGYRTCHDVDPHHTYFDYAYGRHDKISYDEDVVHKVKILGVPSEKPQESVLSVDDTVIPQFKKRVRKPSLDCCSAVGGISISVETLGDAKDRYLVQVVSHSAKEGAKTGSKLISLIDCNLHTMEENRVESIATGSLTKERKSYIAICETGYYNKVTRICGEHKVVKRFYHTFKDAHDFLLEGANIVLLRYIALRRHKGIVRTHAVVMNGRICESIYVSHGVSQAVVNGKSLFVVKIERHLLEPNGVMHQTLTVLTLKGYTVSHEWADSCYVMHINPLLRILPEKDEIEPHAPLREYWRQDLQLFSDYLDYKSARKSEGARYISENSDLSNVVCEYLQSLLLLRPEDAMEFTREYFGTILSTLELPYNEYFS